jgi:hypothetical protein
MLLSFVATLERMPETPKYVSFFGFLYFVGLKQFEFGKKELNQSNCAFFLVEKDLNLMEVVFESKK